MALHPDAQRRAQEFLDQVCKDRLPEFSDYNSLPYIHALVRECLRWHPVAALSERSFNFRQPINIPARIYSVFQIYRVALGRTMFTRAITFQKGLQL